MEVYDAIMKRRSIRKYIDRDIPKEEIFKIAKAGIMAPSASNFQPWSFLFVTDENLIKKIGEGLQGFISEARLIIVGTYDKNVNKSWNVVDTAISLQNMVLYCTSAGLGTCWVGAFNKKRVRQLCNIPESHEILALITVGFADPSFPTGNYFRKDLEDTFFNNTWDEPFPGFENLEV
ncbi:MAG: nitroreductase family protein [Candidatus Hodarchaeota archaeon]